MEKLLATPWEISQWQNDANLFQRFWREIIKTTNIKLDEFFQIRHRREGRTRICHLGSLQALFLGLETVLHKGSLPEILIHKLLEVKAKKFQENNNFIFAPDNIEDRIRQYPQYITLNGKSILDYLNGTNLESLRSTEEDNIAIGLLSGYPLADSQLDQRMQKLIGESLRKCIDIIRERIDRPDQETALMINELYIPQKESFHKKNGLILRKLISVANVDQALAKITMDFFDDLAEGRINYEYINIYGGVQWIHYVSNQETLNHIQKILWTFEKSGILLPKQQIKFLSLNYLPAALNLNKR